MFTILSLILAQAFAVDVLLTPQPDFQARHYVEAVLNRVPYAQARLTPEGRVRIEGTVRVDVSQLDESLGSAIHGMLLALERLPSFARYDVRDAQISVVGQKNGFSMFLMGTSGVGKTQFAKEVAEQLGLPIGLAYGGPVGGAVQPHVPEPSPAAERAFEAVMALRLERDALETLNLPPSLAVRLGLPRLPATCRGELDDE